MAKMSGYRTKLGPIPEDHFENDLPAPGPPNMSAEGLNKLSETMARNKIEAERIRAARDKPPPPTTPPPMMIDTPLWIANLQTWIDYRADLDRLDPTPPNLSTLKAEADYVIAQKQEEA